MRPTKAILEKQTANLLALTGDSNLLELVGDLMVGNRSVVRPTDDVSKLTSEIQQLKWRIGCLESELENYACVTCASNEETVGMVVEKASLLEASIARSQLVFDALDELGAPQRYHTVTGGDRERDYIKLSEWVRDRLAGR